MIDLLRCITPAIYLLCGFGVSNILTKAGIDRPVVIIVLMFPLVLMIVALAKIDRWE